MFLGLTAGAWAAIFAALVLWLVFGIARAWWFNRQLAKWREVVFQTGSLQIELTGELSLDSDSYQAIEYDIRDLFVRLGAWDAADLQKDPMEINKVLQLGMMGITVATLQEMSGQAVQKDAIDAATKLCELLKVFPGHGKEIKAVLAEHYPDFDGTLGGSLEILKKALAAGRLIELPIRRVK